MGMADDPAARRVTSALATLAWVLVAAAPVVAGVIAVRGGWTAISDWAMIAARTLETFSSDPPLVGMPTSLSFQTERVLFHPGPLPFWLYAVPTRLLGEPGYGLIVGAVAINVAAVVAMALMFRRPRVRLLVVAGALAVALLESSMGGQLLRDPFNPSVAVLPLLATFVATWSVLAGHPRSMVVLAVFGSIAAQAHVINLPAFGMLVLVAGGHLLVVGWRSRGTDGGRARLRWAAISAGVLLLCWSGPLVDQVAGDGNLWGLLTDGSAADGAGLRFGFERLVETMTVRPGTPFDQGREYPPPEVPTAVVLAAAAIAAGMAVLAVRAWRSGRRELAAIQVAALLAAAAAALTTAQVPTYSTLSPNNNLIWLPVRSLVVLAVGWGLVAVVGAVAGADLASRLGDRARRLVAPAVALVGVVAVAASLAGIGPLDPRGDGGSGSWGAARTHATAIAGAVPAGETVVLDTDGTPTALGLLLTSLIGQLRLQGVEVRYSSEIPDLGTFSQYHETSLDPGAPRFPVLIRAGGDAREPLEGYRELSYYDPAEPMERYEGYDGRLFLVGLEPSSIFVREPE
jgi:hypothetical protein